MDRCIDSAVITVSIRTGSMALVAHRRHLHNIISIIYFALSYRMLHSILQDNVMW